MKRISIAVLVLTVLVLGSAMAFFPGASQAKDSLTLALRGEPDEGFDPLMGWGRYGNPMFQSTLLARDNDLGIVKDLAVDYSLSKDGLVWTVSIRKDARFSDGKPVRPEDVAFTFNEGGKSGGKTDLTNLREAAVVGPDLVEIRLKKPDSTFINRLITLGIVPEHAHGPDYGRKPVGSGPYVMASWTQGEKMIAEINPDYYGRKPAFKRIVFLYGAEDAMFAAAKAGQVDMVAVPSQLGKQQVSGMRVLPVRSVDNRGLMFPMVKDEGRKTPAGAPIGNNLTVDPALRRAINLALDRQALVDGILEGFGRPAYFVCDGLPWDNPDTQIPDADIAGAQNIRADAGWTA
ncbi:MAG: ABC transporter substrate-binding protein, partial [Pseudomonadota bacterium]